ncbi:IPT/TIG domain-containing protein [Fodinibius sp. N2]|uniref:IPT/TIG domain-containing protein n=1 Tax=Fodinibius alkaliphilus TaxID=3140241 RepID=UPI00315B0ED3
MHLSFDRPFWALLFVIGIAITIASCGGSSSGPDINKLKIVSVVPDSGMVGDSVTIKGSGGFASRLSDNILTFNGTPATVLSTTPDQLITKVPGGATSGRLTLEVNDQTVKGPHFKVLGFTPAITGVSPVKATPGTEVRIKGTHFLSGSASTNKTPNDLLPDNKQTKEPLAKNKTNNAASLSAPGAKRPGIGMPSPRSDIPQNKNTSKLKVSAAQNKANATITTTNADAISITFGGQQAPVHSATDTLLITEVPEGASGNIIEVTVGEQSMEWDAFQLLTPLNVLSLSPESGPVRTSVTVQGEGFHTTADSNIVAFNSIEAEVTAASPTELSVVVPPKAESGAVTVEAHGQTAQGPTFTVTVPTTDLSISGISPTGGPAGTNVTITGQGFSATPSENTVSFDGSQATVSAATTEKLTATVPDGATTGPVSVTIDNETVNGPTFNVSTNSPPTFTSPASLSIKENTSLVDTVVASDVDGDALTFSISGGDDQDLFTIDEQTGVLAFSSIPDYENPSDINADNIYELQISANDGSLSANQGVSITVTDVNENQSPSFTSRASFNVNENATDIGTLTANDPEGDAITLSISGGTDQDLFNLEEQSGELSFKTAPDHEDPTDADNDNIYELQVEAADNNGSTSQDITVDVQNLNDNSPYITQSTYEIEENKTEIGTIVATDPDGDALTFELNGGVDEDAFTLDTQTGALSFKYPRDYEQPTDGQQIGYPTDNEYEVNIGVRDDENITFESLTVVVKNVAEPVEIVRGSIQNQYQTEQSNGQFVFDLVPDGFDTGNSAILIVLDNTKGTAQSATIGGPDAGLFMVEGILTAPDRIQISGPVLDYDHSADGTPHQYQFTVTTTSTEGATEAPQTFVIPITPFSGGSGTASDPYLVSTLEQLQAVDMFRNAHFRQTRNIDASATASWNSGEGFKPIATQNNPFTGSYDGAGFTISGLTMNLKNSERYLAFIEVLGAGADITNIHLETASYDISAGAILVGLNKGTIINSSVSGSIKGWQGGGLVYLNEGTIEDSHSEATVDMSSGGLFYVIGGLVGRNDGTAIIRNSYSTGDVTGNAMTGGLVGWNLGGTITHSYAEGTVTGDGVNHGGLVGVNDSGGEIKYSHAKGDVGGRDAGDPGGLVSRNNSLIQESYAYGFVTTASIGGGLVAKNDKDGIIRNSFAIGDLESLSGDYFEVTLGGLVGENRGEITGSWTIGDMTSYSSDQSGALVGFNDPTLGTINNSYFNKSVGIPTSDGGRGLTSTEITGSNAPLNMNFDFDTIWKQGEESNYYPTLRNNPVDGVLVEPSL